MKNTEPSSAILNALFVLSIFAALAIDPCEWMPDPCLWDLTTRLVFLIGGLTISTGATVISNLWRTHRYMAWLMSYGPKSLPLALQTLALEIGIDSTRILLIDLPEPLA